MRFSILLECFRLQLNYGTRTAQMLLQFQIFVFEKYPFLKENYFHNEAILNVFGSIFPSEFPNDQQVFLDALKVYCIGRTFGYSILVAVPAVKD